jgi:deoxyribonuclease IV
MDKTLIGSHLPLAAPEYYLGTVKLAYEYGETSFMFYTGAPQSTLRIPTSNLRIPEGRAFLKSHGYDESKIVVHAPYIINLGNKNNGKVYDLAKSFLIQELRRVDAFGLSILVLHPGSRLDESVEFCLQSVIEGLDEVLSADGTSVRIALETMAGKGSELGTTFEDLSKIIQGSKRPERLGICLDTCHINDDGFDDEDIDGIIGMIESTVGLKNLLAIHLNDSKNIRGSHKDRHENIGYGTIGFQILERYVSDPRLASIPKILETPMVGDEPPFKSPYKKEIEMLVKGTFEQGWREKL